MDTKMARTNKYEKFKKATSECTKTVYIDVKISDPTPMGRGTPPPSSAPHGPPTFYILPPPMIIILIMINRL